MKIRTMLAVMLFIPATAFAAGGDKAMSQLDQNSDGKVSADEFTQHAREKFRRADTNSDGSLDQNEYQQMASQAQSRMQSGQEQRRGRMGQDTGSQSQQDR